MSDFLIRLLKCFFISSQSLKDYEHRRWNNDFRLFKITIPRNVKIFVPMCVNYCLSLPYMITKEIQLLLCNEDGLAKLLHWFEMNT